MTPFEDGSGEAVQRLLGCLAEDRSSEWLAGFERELRRTIARVAEERVHAIRREVERTAAYGGEWG